MSNGSECQPEVVRKNEKATPVHRVCGHSKDPASPGEVGRPEGHEGILNVTTDAPSSQEQGRAKSQAASSDMTEEHINRATERILKKMSEMQKPRTRVREGGGWAKEAPHQGAMEEEEEEEEENWLNEFANGKGCPIALRVRCPRPTSELVT